MAICFFLPRVCPCFLPIRSWGVIISYRYINVFNSPDWMKSSALVFVVVSPGSWTLVIGTRGRQHFTRSTRLNNYTLMQLFYSWKQVSIPATQTFNFIEVSRIVLPTLQHKAGHLLWKITSSCLSENYSGAHTLQVYTCQYTGVE